MAKHVASNNPSSSITKTIRAKRHALHQARKPYYSRMGFDTRTQYRQWKRAERRAQEMSYA